MKPRVLMVGRTRYRLPLNESLARKFGALDDRLDLRVLAAAPRGASGGDDTFALQRGTPVAALDGPVFYGSLPVRIARELRRERRRTRSSRRARTRRSRRSPDARSRGATRPSWSRSTATGAPGRVCTARAARAIVAPLADRAALVAIRRADAVRTLSPFTTGIVRDAGVEPAGVFTTYTELTAFSEPPVAPLPERPSPCSSASPSDTRTSMRSQTPGASRRRGSRTRRSGSSATAVTATSPEALVRDFPGRVTGTCDWRRPDVVKAFDDSWLLLLASRSEGTPRVVLEALCRGRAVVGARAGGIPDVVLDGETGAARRPRPAGRHRRRARPVLSDRALAERLGEGGRALCARRGRTRPRSTPTASSSSSGAPSRRAGHEARRRHAAGRPCEPGARRHGRQAARARRAGRRARRPRGQRRRRRAARQLPRAAVPVRSPGRPRAPLRERALARARPAAAAGRRSRAHVPDLRRPRRAGRPAAARARAPVVHALAPEPAALDGRAPLDARPQRRPADVPAAVEEGRRDRPRDRRLRPSVRRAPGDRDAADASRARDAPRRRRGSRRSSARSRSSRTSSCSSSARP